MTFQNARFQNLYLLSFLRKLVRMYTEKEDVGGRRKGDLPEERSEECFDDGEDDDDDDRRSQDDTKRQRDSGGIFPHRK